MDKAESGGFDSKGRDDILAKAMNKPERGGHVVAIGSGITNKEYFGYHKPTPPNQLLARIDQLCSEIGAMKNYQNLLTSFVMSSLNKDQVSQLMALDNSSPVNAFNIGSSGETTSSQQQDYATTLSKSTSTLNASFTQLLGVKGVDKQSEGVKFSLVSSHPTVHEKDQEVEPYIVSWPTTQDQQPIHTQQPNLHMLDSSRTHFFPEVKMSSYITISILVLVFYY